MADHHSLPVCRINMLATKYGMFQKVIKLYPQCTLPSWRTIPIIKKRPFVVVVVVMIFENDAADCGTLPSSRTRHWLVCWHFCSLQLQLQSQLLALHKNIQGQGQDKSRQFELPRNQKDIKAMVSMVSTVSEERLRSSKSHSSPSLVDVGPCGSFFCQVKYHR